MMASQYALVAAMTPNPPRLLPDAPCCGVDSRRVASEHLSDVDLGVSLAKKVENDPLSSIQVSFELIEHCPRMCRLLKPPPPVGDPFIQDQAIALMLIQAEDLVRPLSARSLVTSALTMIWFFPSTTACAL